jgi:hypothetical protein
MLRDVFYYGAKPNVHPRERPAQDLDDARQQATTEHFWIINEFCDYSGFDWDFDFEFLSDDEVWAENHINIWPSIYQKDSGTWLVCNNDSDVKIYRSDVTRLKRKNIKTKEFVLIDKVDESKFDFGWHPDPNDPPYIYRWGNRYFPVELGHVMEYIVPGAEEVKYMSTVVELLPDWERWQIPDYIDLSTFDFSWRPDPREPEMIYDFGTQWQRNGGPRYVCEGATDIKCVDGIRARALPRKNDSGWQILPGINLEHFDYTWHPDNTSPPYIYVFGNQYYSAVTMPTVEYHVPGATEKKYVQDCWGTLAPSKENWIIPDNVEDSTFDFRWVPNPNDPPYIYEFATEHQKNGGPKYIIDGATEIKYIDLQKAKTKQQPDKFEIIGNIKVKSFDYSWHPDNTEQPYIYVFGNNFYRAEDMPTIRYVVEGATEIKYVHDVVAILDVSMDNWVIPDHIDTTDFDFSWVPNPNDPAYVYEFGTQWQNNGGPKYVVEGATEIKYMDIQRAKTLPNKNNWQIPNNIDESSFDFSWHPDNTAPAYVYQFGTQWGKSGGPIYTVANATEVQYVNISAVAVPNLERWKVPNDVYVENFDFSWHPSIEDQPYVYKFGTQWQKTGGPSYYAVGANDNSPVKYIDVQKATKLPNKNKFTIFNNYKIDSFDYSWHPDDTDAPYIYRFGNQFYDAENMPTLEYVVEGATEYKYVHDVIATLAQDKSAWIMPDDIDDSDFDYSWKPKPSEPPYIYVAGTQHQKTGGPRYVVDGATQIKYLEKTVKKLPNKLKFAELTEYEIEDFDYSWHPDDTDPPYIYQFGNTLYDAEIMPTLEYTVEGAMYVKYINNVKAKLTSDKSRWIIPESIDDSTFDYSWVPNPKDPPYIYVTGTQHQKTGGPKFVVEGATEFKYLKQKVIKLEDKSKFEIITDAPISDFDYSWHPDDSDPPYIYQFGNNFHEAEMMPTVQYVVEGAMYVKYINDIKATLAPNKPRWLVPENIDDSMFDYSWVPNPKDPPYIYVTGTQHQKTGGPKYVVEGADEIKYLNKKVRKLEDKSKFEIIDAPVLQFDYSWHPDDSDPPYVYKFGNNFYEAEIMPTVQYVVEGAMHTKYIDSVKAILAPNKPRWIVPENIDDSMFDYSWVPNPTSPPYIYIAGTQHQKTGGPQYVVEGATHAQYIEQKVQALPNKSKFEIIDDYNIESFDFSWHPDDTDPPYIYLFGNQYHDAEIMPTVKYVVEGAIYEKYISHIKATLGQDRRNWSIPKNLDVTKFNFSWKPSPKEPPYVYRFGTQWQKTGGPTYTVTGATEIKYVDWQKATYLPNSKDPRWVIPEYIDSTGFDFSWHPDSTEVPYIYEFGTQWQDNGGIRFEVPGAKQINYVGGDNKAKALPRGDNWIIPDGLDIDSFDFSWHPDNTAPPYVYQFGTQHQKTGGPRYVAPGVDPSTTFVNYVSQLRAIKLPTKKNWIIPDNITNFDYSWHPDDTDPPMIYQFGTQWQKTGGPKYVVDGAVDIKYVDKVKATRLPSKDNWTVPENIKDFDYSWHPDDTEPPYIYEFATQWNNRGGPVYTVPDAVFNKYIEDVTATLKPSKNNWEIPNDVDTSNFDFSWVPHPQAPPYIYQFGTQWQKTGGPRYVVPGATEVTYVTDVKGAIKLPNRNNYSIPENIGDFDYSWHPDDTDPPYIYQFGTQWQKTGGPRYVVEGGIEIKYIDAVKAVRLPSMDNWTIPDNIKDFDYSWHPDDTEPPYIYEFATVWNSRGGPVYTVPEAVFNKYVEDVKATTKVDKSNWQIPEGLDTSNFDFSWVPHPQSPPYIYQFGTQWQKTGGPKYVVPEASEIKYVTDIKGAIKLPSNKNWVIPNDIADFDFSWHPDDTDPPMIYQFGTQWQKTGGPSYVVAGAVNVKYDTTLKAKKLPNKDNWTIPENIKDFDFSWHPDDTDPPYIYEFATVWDVMVGIQRNGPIYTVDGANFKKFIDAIRATTKPSMNNWIIPDGVDVSDFDFSWLPDSTYEPKIYQFGTSENENDGPRYVAPGNKGEIVKLPRVYVSNTQEPIVEMIEVKENNTTEVTRLEIKYVPVYTITVTLDDLVLEHPEETFWAVRENIDYTNFDFSWRPTVDQSRYVQVFGSPDYDVTQTYFVSAPLYRQGFTDLNYVEPNTNVDEEYLAKLFKPNDMFFVDKGNIEAKDRFEKLKIKFPNIQKTRFLNSWVDTINRCINRSNTELCWILNSELDYSNFNFNYYPNQYQTRMVHVFGTQWSHWGTTFLVNRETFAIDTKYIKIIEHLSNLNFVKDRRAVATNNLYDIVLIDHDNKDTDKVKDLLTLKSNGKTVSVIKYNNTYLETLQTIVKNQPTKKDHYLWICSSICDYGQFDFSYICDPFARDNLHVFYSETQKFGDTFLIDVNLTREIINSLEDLRKYPKVTYNSSVKAKRISAPVVRVDNDTHVGSLNVDFSFPYMIFATEDFASYVDEPISLWDKESKNLVITSTGCSRIIVPKEAKDIVKNELYDYPYIKTANRLSKSKPLDIVFLSNGELCADENYEHLLAVTKGISNRIVRVDGVDGRVQGYHAALEASQTPWAFTVFAKLKVNNKFDWGWQPDRLQIPKHYIFNAKNPVNGLVYGHQALIAYNKKLTLANTGKGLDFTLDDPHESVDILSGVATFNTDPYSTWRTAFREVIKLKSDYSDIASDRLSTWLTVGEGEFSEYSIQGALDAVEYYDQVMGDIEELKKSYEWTWLKEYYRKKYK